MSTLGHGLLEIAAGGRRAGRGRFLAGELMHRRDAARFPDDDGMGRDEIDVAEVDLLQPLRRAGHRGGDEVELALLQHRDAFGARHRDGLHRDAQALGHGMHQVEVVADHGVLAGLLEAERRGGVADADDELAARLDLVQPVRRRRHGQRKQRRPPRQRRSSRGFSRMCLPGRPQKHVMAVAPTSSGSGYRSGRYRAACRPVNLPLGLTFYCSDLVRRHHAAPNRSGLPRDASTPGAFPRFRGDKRRRWPAAAARPSRQVASSDTTGSIRAEAAPRSNVEWRQEMESWGERYRANPADPDAAIKYAQALRAIGQRAQAAAVLERAAINNPDTARCSAPMAGRSPTTASFQQALDVLNRAHTPGPARLAHPVGAGRGARPDGPPRRRAALLRERAAADAGRAVGPVQSRAVLRAVEGSAAGRGDVAARRRAARGRAARCGRTSRWWSACRAASRRPRRSRAATCRPTEAAAERRLSAADAGAAATWKKDQRRSPLTPSTGS